MPSFKERLAHDELIRVFAVSRVTSPVLIEMIGLAGGYDGFWIDQEHSAVPYDQIVTLSLAARANGMDCFVRMAPIGYWQVTQNLEAGAGGVMAAQIHSVEQAEQFVQWAKFAPRGCRGINTGGRDADYTHKPAAQFAADANRDGLVAIQIESAAAADAADGIAALDGVDLLFIGPADLSLSLGIVGQFHHEKLWQAIQKVATAAKRHGKHWGAMPSDPEFAKKAIDLGCRMITIGNDVLAFRRGIEALKAAYGVGP
jgi:2-dehydro-3-deoxyglucarate aldolase/4-hydroxy-2-oxoheptanedioate aldolase